MNQSERAALVRQYTRCEETFARVLGYAERPIHAALDAFSAARRTTAEILARLTDTDWAREGPTPIVAATPPKTG